MKKLLLALLMLATPAVAQNYIVQNGQVTPGHVPYWITNGVLGDGGTAQTPVITSLGTIGQGNTICANSAPITGSYNQLCLGTSGTGGTLTLNNFGGASGGLVISSTGNVTIGGLTSFSGAGSASKYVCVDSSGNVIVQAGAC